jgi:hypothetical protein
LGDLLPDEDASAANIATVESKIATANPMITGIATRRFRNGEPTSARTRPESADPPIK